MRLKVYFQLKKIHSGFFEKDYRFYFASFINEILDLSKDPKPFVFSVKICKEKAKADLIFSTGEEEIFSTFQNKVLEIKEQKKEIKTGLSKLSISEILSLEKVSFNSDFALFKTEICILTNPNASPDDFHRWFCVPEDENFQEVFEKRTLQRYQMIKGVRISDKIEIDTKQSETIYVNIYDGEEEFLVRGFTGIFGIRAKPYLLNFIYDYGIGIHTSRGFGLSYILQTT